MRPRRLQLRGVLAVLALCSVIPAGAQERPAAGPAVTPSPTPIADAAEQIARDLWPVSFLDEVRSEGSTFRLNIHVPEADVRPPWLQDPDPVTRRPIGGSLYHQQMLEAIVPEEFRGSTFYTPGVSVDPATIVNGIRGMWHDWQTRRIREQIARELAELEAANAAEATR